MGEFVKKNAGEQVHIERREYHGYDLIDVRVYVQNERGELVPTKQGVCCRAETWGDIVEVVNRLLDIEPSEMVEGGTA
jgi:hypothetical protein